MSGRGQGLWRGRGWDGAPPSEAGRATHHTTAGSAAMFDGLAPGVFAAPVMCIPGGQPVSHARSNLRTWPRLLSAAPVGCLLPLPLLQAAGLRQRRALPALPSCHVWP